MKKLLLLFLLIFSSAGALEILYEKNTPFIKKQNDTLGGIVATPAIKALDSLNISYTLNEVSLDNQLALLKSTDKNICAINWFKDDKLKGLVNYSKVIYKDKPLGIITQQRYKIEDNTHIDRIIKERKYRALVKKQHDYDKEVLKILRMLPVKVINTSKDNNLVNLIAKRRGDYTFISYEKAQLFVNKHKYRSRFKFVPIAGMPEGRSRYLVCSKGVDQSLLNRFNKNLK